MAFDGCALASGSKFAGRCNGALEDFDSIRGSRGVCCVGENFEGAGEIKSIKIFVEVEEDFEGLGRSRGSHCGVYYFQDEMYLKKTTI